MFLPSNRPDIKSDILDHLSQVCRYLFSCFSGLLSIASALGLSPALENSNREIHGAISAILLSVLFISNGKIIFPRGRQVFLLTVMGLCGITLNNIFQFTGLQYSTAINCALVSSTTPAATAVLAAMFLREKLTIGQWIGIFISFFGILFLLTHGSLEALMTLTFNYGDKFN